MIIFPRLGVPEVICILFVAYYTQEVIAIQIRDNYQKIVLTLDRNLITSYNGIKVVNLIDWLM